MPVFHLKYLFRGFDDLMSRWNQRTGKDIFMNPGIGMEHRLITSDRMQKKESMAIQTALYNFKEMYVIFISHMFEHPDRYHPVKLFIHITVIHQKDVDIQTFT